MVEVRPRLFEGWAKRRDFPEFPLPLSQSDRPEESVTNHFSLISQKRHQLPGWWEWEVIGWRGAVKSDAGPCLALGKEALVNLRGRIGRLIGVFDFCSGSPWDPRRFSTFQLFDSRGEPARGHPHPRWEER